MASKILDPLVTKFILPEHIEMLRQLHEDKKRIIPRYERFYKVNTHFSRGEIARIKAGHSQRP
ncbi:hypothetical protein [Brevibacillus laterosporus]|uniref:hypothetical protein n=1 Tax=Brevibacillus laterosporus TaxID=1465 RepID=UPI00265267CC|nr:hypothetical protein [Brevibacillus laterosporus]MDN9008972.1 hypothetical protein [Brevibacillus laterosporus]MDO0941079.1 hypothetical protein [Brevibacillus laterosporus]